MFKGGDGYGLVIDFDPWAADLIQGEALAFEPGADRAAEPAAPVANEAERH